MKKFVFSVLALSALSLYSCGDSSDDGNDTDAQSSREKIDKGIEEEDQALEQVRTNQERLEKEKEMLDAVEAEVGDQIEGEGLVSFEPKDPEQAVEAWVSADYAANGCDFVLIYVDANDNQEKMGRPIDLPEEFQEHGLQVKAEFRYSRAPNDGCNLANPIVIESIEKL